MQENLAAMRRSALDWKMPPARHCGERPAFRLAPLIHIPFHFADYHRPAAVLLGMARPTTESIGPAKSAGRDS
ncbi:hypothetical protein [Burkholderia multivorans]|uniref:hypothetical protein n=1 Tax=Burkholderia multivorans TaxID=87883 RepID=UPI0013DFF527|nr:hypothetical protein [Burkholderia multivorans]MBU9620571.1 hypothetical protein [Burkholderia multivorans]NGM75478.1 hypothetical protein [Burkholderia multivorans]